MKLASLVSLKPLKEAAESFPSKEKWDGNEEGQLGVSNLYDLPPNIFNKRVEEREAIISKLGKPNKAEAWAYKSWSFLFRPDGGKLSEGSDKDTHIKKMGRWNLDTSTQAGKDIEKQFKSIPTVSSKGDWGREEANEGTCGYGPDGVPGDTPGGTKGMPADDRTRGMLKKLIQKEVRKLTIGKSPITK